MLVVRTGVVDESLPSRERGLKSHLDAGHVTGLVVAPFTGAWIEIPGAAVCSMGEAGRSLHGSVD